MKREDVLGLLRDFGFDANSFFAVYPHFQHFTLPERRGSLPYVDTPKAWIGLSPLCSKEDKMFFWEAFREAAFLKSKRALLMPLGESEVKELRTRNVGAIPIGSECLFHLKAYKAVPSQIQSADRLKRRGAFVEEFRPLQLSASVKEELDAVLAEWIANLKTEPLSFLNQVDPWFCSEEKKYFFLKFEGLVQAYVAAIPMMACNGWYFVDVIRRSESPVGSTELLILSSMAELKNQGASVISMGVAPLSRLKRADFGPHQRAYRWVSAFAEKGEAFYNFKSLIAFKDKFRPTQHETAYLAFSPPNFGLRVVLDVFRAFLPKGLLSPFLAGLAQEIRSIDVGTWLRKQMKSSRAVRAQPMSQLEGLYRIKLTLFLLVFQVVVYATTHQLSGLLDPALAQRWAFSTRAFFKHGYSTVYFSPWLHWTPWHLGTNLVTTFLFCGTLELFSGTFFMGLSYFTGLVFANPLTAVVILTPLKFLLPAFATQFLSERDVGSSLGIFGCIGALSIFLKRGRELNLAAIIVVAIFALATSSVMSLNHLVALGLGYLVAYLKMGG